MGEDGEALLDHDEGPHGRGVHPDAGATGVIDAEDDPGGGGVAGAQNGAVGLVLAQVVVVVAAFEADPPGEAGPCLQMHLRRRRVAGGGLGGDLGKEKEEISFELAP